MSTFCYFNGSIIPFTKAVLPVTDLGLLRAYAVFDFLRTYKGKPFMLKEHMTRFRNSAKLLGLKVPITDKEALEIIQALMKKNKMSEVSVRLVLTGGDTFGAKIDNKQRSFFILTEPIHMLPVKSYTDGVKVVTHIYERSFPTAKTTHYTVALADAQRRKKEKALETLFVFGANVLECTTSNFFIFKGDILITPKDHILLGMTRNKVVDIARKYFTVEERDVVVSELTAADEAFLTATNKEIVPVVMIDKTHVGNGRVGENTKKLIKLFQEYVNAL
ncbi:MAG: aminotransferase class IV [Candidatus Paceibacterota bacterium]|jgi:branched-subunit amino acid aminotransferase/4-amino-4-deoxychorismate lyase